MWFDHIEHMEEGQEKNKEWENFRWTVDEDMFTYVIKSRIDGEETVMAKHAFECSADICGVKITHYHADNGCIADNAFITNCKDQRQGLSYCGVNAHFQNGIAER